MKKATQTFHVYSQHVVNLPQLDFYYSFQMTVPEVDQISNKSWLCVKGARASLYPSGAKTPRLCFSHKFDEVKQ